MTEFVVRIDGEQGELFVDGERAELFGALVGLEVRRDDLDVAPLAESSPFIIRARERPVVEVTLRFPLGGGDRLTVLRGPHVEDVEGPTADGERERLVHDNPALAQQIREGVEEAEAGRTVSLGSFAQYLDDEDEEPGA